MNRPEFIPCYKTRDLQLLSILKFHLEEKEIPHFIMGEDSIFLENLAVPMSDAYAVLYLLPVDVEQFLQFVEEGVQ